MFNSFIVSKATTSSSVITATFVEHLVSILDFPPIFLANIDLRFTWRYIIAECDEHGVKTINLMEKFYTTNCHVERSNCTILWQCSQSAAARQRNWSTMPYRLKYLFEKQIHCFMYPSPFTSVLRKMASLLKSARSAFHDLNTTDKITERATITQLTHEVSMPAVSTEDNSW